MFVDAGLRRRQRLGPGVRCEDCLERKDAGGLSEGDPGQVLATISTHGRRRAITPDRMPRLAVCAPGTGLGNNGLCFPCVGSAYSPGGTPAAPSPSCQLCPGGLLPNAARTNCTGEYATACCALKVHAMSSDRYLLCSRDTYMHDHACKAMEPFATCLTVLKDATLKDDAGRALISSAAALPLLPAPSPTTRP